MTDKRKIQLEAEVITAPAKQGFTEIGQAAHAMAQSVQQSGEQASRGVDKLGTGADGAAQKLDRGTKSIIGSIERTTAAMKAGERGTAAYFEVLANQRGADAGALKPYLDQLRQAEVAQKSATGSLNTMGVSAAQTNAALRQLPAQFTDIITSLQGGQAPLTVLLQQGGQIKDSFGGAGNAARALGSYVMGLVNPMTLAAAAAGVLAMAYFKGAHEVELFNKTLILSGNAAGVTSGQLADVAAGMAKFGVTQGAAVEVLSQMAAAGISGAVNLRQFASAALELERVGGPAASETAKAFADLAKSPLEASIKLNDATHYLTRSLVEQIDTLDKQGRHVEAAQVAMDAYADAVNKRTPALLNNLGLIERAWLAIKSAGAGLADSVISLGRPEGNDAKLKELQTRLAEREKNNQATYGRPDDAATDGLRQQIAALSKRVLLQQEAAAAEGEAARQVEAATKWGKEQDGYMPNRLKMEREIVAAKNEGAAAGAKQAEIEARIAVIRQRYDTGTNIEAIKQAELARTEEIKRGVESINTLRATGYISERTAIEETSRLNIDAIDAHRAALLGELAIVSKKQNAERETAALVGELAAVERARIAEWQSQATKMTMLLYAQQKAIYAVVDAEREAARTEEVQAYLQEYAAREKIQTSLTEYNRSLNEEAEAMALELSLLGQTNQVRETRLKQFQIELALRRRLDEIDATHYDGGEDEREQVRRQARDAAVKASAQASTRAYLDEARRTAEQVEQMLTDALMRGFESGKGFAENLRDTVVNIFKTMVLRPVIQAIVAPISGAASALFGGPVQAAGQAAGASGGASSAFSALGSAAGLGSMTGLGSIFSAGAQLTGWTGSGTGMALEGAGAMIGNGSIAQGLAQGAGALAPWLGGAAIGVYGGRAISGGYSAIGGPSGNTAVNAGTIIGAVVGGPIGAAIGGAIGGVVNRAFGMKEKELKDGGIEGSISATGASGQAYQDWFQRGGWFRSNRSGTDKSAMSEELDSLLDTGAAAIMDQTKNWAKVLSLPADALASVTTQFKVKLTGDAKADDAAIASILEQYQSALSSQFSAVLQPFQKAGETLADTLKRMAGVQVFSDSINQLGGIFSKIAGASVSAKEGLINLAGGMESFSQQAQGFVQNYYTRDEIAGGQAADARKALASVGITQDISATDPRAQFRALVESTDVNSEEGRKRLATLLGMQDKFAGLADYLSESGKSLSSAAAGAPAISVLGPMLSSGAAQQVQATNGVKDAIDSMHETLAKLYERMGITGSQSGGFVSNRWREVGVAP